MPQPHAVRAGLSARDPGDGVRRAQPRLCFLQGGLHARHLRQHEDGGRGRVHRQGPPVQPPLSADVWALPGRADRLHAGVGLGEGAGREPGRGGARALLHAAAAGGELRGAERLVARPMRRLRQGAQASRADRLHDLAGFRGGASAAGADYWAIRRVPRDASLGLEDLSGAVRQQQVLGRLARRRPAGRDPGLCRSHRDPPGRRDRRRASPPLRPRRDDLRSLALRAGARQEARRPA